MYNYQLTLNLSFSKLKLLKLLKSAFPFFPSGSTFRMYFLKIQFLSIWVVPFFYLPYCRRMASTC